MWLDNTDAWNIKNIYTTQDHYSPGCLSNHITHLLDIQLTPITNNRAVFRSYNGQETFSPIMRKPRCLLSWESLRSLPPHVPKIWETPTLWLKTTWREVQFHGSVVILVRSVTISSLIGWGEMNMHPAVSVRAKTKSIRNCSLLGLEGDKLLALS